MTIKLKRIIIYKYFSILFLFTITNCISITVPPYSLSKQNIIDAKKIKTKYPNLKIKLGEFRETSAIKVYCNGINDIKANPDYATYIKEGIRDELEVAEVYDEGANIVLSGKVSFILANFPIGKRKFIMDVSINNKKNYSVESDFNPPWIILNGCPYDTDKILPTIQTLISEILNHPDLSEFINETK
jgi:hypothetical protein